MWDQLSWLEQTKTGNRKPRSLIFPVVNFRLHFSQPTHAEPENSRLGAPSTTAWWRGKTRRSIACCEERRWAASSCCRLEPTNCRCPKSQIVRRKSILINIVYKSRKIIKIAIFKSVVPGTVVVYMYILRTKKYSRWFYNIIFIDLA